MRFLLFSLSIVFADQFSKLFVKGFSLPFLNIQFEGLRYGQRFPVFGNVFGVTFIENPGIAFGLEFGSDYKLLLSVITALACVGLLVYFYFKRNESRALKLSLAAIIGGAFGNLIDRVFYGVIYGYAPLMHGKVVDFLDLNFFNIYFFNKTLGNYIFNIADLAVTFGVVFLIFSLRKVKKEPEELVPSLSDYPVDSRE